MLEQVRNIQTFTVQEGYIPVANKLSKFGVPLIEEKKHVLTFRERCVNNCVTARY